MKVKVFNTGVTEVHGINLSRTDCTMPLSFYKTPGLVVYVTCGDPDLATTRDVVLAAIEAGADVIELGVPFSDPVADGPVIQRASERALKHGTCLAQVLTLAAEVRERAQSTGLVVFSYLNPILRMGMEKFCTGGAACGRGRHPGDGFAGGRSWRLFASDEETRSGAGVSGGADQSG